MLFRAQTHLRARGWRYFRNQEFINRMKRRSMLHQETLLLLDFFARRAEHGILEIGAYMGGATAVIAKALQDVESRVPFVTIEAGGAHDHPELPSADILSDLRHTLASEWLSHHVRIIEGLSETPETIQAVRKSLKQIDLLVIDAEGRIGKDFENYGALLTPGAIIVCDDYLTGEADPAPEKQELVNPWIDAAVKSGRLKTLGVYQWGTWFGQLTLSR